jgi:hypothetical protein
MADDLVHVAAAAARRAVEQTLSITVEGSRDTVVSMLAARIPHALAGVSGTLLVEFAGLLLKSLLQSDDAIRRIEREVATLAREPVATAFEQFRIAGMSTGTDQESVRHRQERYRSCLFNLDRAWVVADKSEKPAIDLLRGLCALQVPGASAEAKAHLAAFIKEADSESNRLAVRANEGLSLAESLEKAAASIAVEGGPGVGGGLAGTALALPRIKRAELVRKAQAARRQSEEALAVSGNLIVASACASALLAERSASA